MLGPPPPSRQEALLTEIRDLLNFRLDRLTYSGAYSGADGDAADELKRAEKTASHALA